MVFTDFRSNRSDLPEPKAVGFRRPVGKKENPASETVVPSSRLRGGIDEHPLRCTHFYISIVHRSARDERGHDSKKILQRRMMNQRFTFTLPARYCSSKISRFQSFHLPPRRLSSLPLHLQCPRWWRWRRPQRWQRVEEAGTCGGAPSLPSVTASSSSSPSSLDSTLPSPTARRCSPSRRQCRGCLRRLRPPALAQVVCLAL